MDIRLDMERVVDAGMSVWLNLGVGGAGYREGNGTPLQYSCLENTMDRGAW